MTEQEKDTLETAQDDAPPATDAVEETAAADPAADDSDAYQWKEPPTFEIAHKENCVCEVKVTIPKANLTAMLNEVYEEVNDGVQVPGFRRGKAPRKLLEKRLGKYARSTAVERLAEHASERLTKEHDVTPVSQAKVEGIDDAENVPEDQDIVYTLTFDTPGKCELGAYEGVEIEKPVVEVPDKEVDATLESMRTRYGRFEPLTEGVAETGDQVIIDFVGKIDGEEFEGNSAENYPYILGSQRFSPEMEEAMTGAKSGDQVSADVTFPEDYRSADLANKAAKFDITIHEIKRRVLPELDDEFAKRVGHDTVGELRDAVRTRIGDNANEQVKEYMQQQARVKLVECCTFDLPKSQIDSFVDSEYKSMEQRLMQQHVPAEAIEEHKEEMRKAAEENGLFQLKLMYAVRAVADKEGIVATEQDFEVYAREFSDSMQQNYEVMKEYLLSDDVRSMTELQIVERKTLDAVVAKASIVLKEISDEEEAADEAKEDATPAEKEEEQNDA